jgi:glycosyltransferase involved in cell wall biosynthesis
VVPEGVDARCFKPGLEPLPIPGRRDFAFLSVFEWGYRKGWDLLLEAWSTTFGPRDDVCLILRTYPTNAADASDVNKDIEASIDQFLQDSLGISRKDIAPIVVLDRQIPQPDMPRLYCSADAYVMPSRGEGWGRPYIEAMACALPTIATRWGGQLAYMNDNNAYLIDVEGMAGNPPYVCAKPSLSHLKDLMIHVFTSQAEAREKGMRARQDVVEHWGWEKAAAVALNRLKDIDSRCPATNPLPPFPNPSSGTQSGPAVVWEGSQFVNHSLALINRELSLQLIESGCELSIIPYEPDQFGPEADPRFKSIADRLRSPLSRPADVHIRHQWPPNFTPPPEGRWVMIQPWEYGRLPQGWIEPMSTLVDEIWVPSLHVKKTYIASGVPADRVFVVPNGVNTQLFRPQAPPLHLATNKGFKFLFVGGAIWRKGIDLLLEAYRSVFSGQDDVVLVIKEMGQNSFYRGQGAGETIRAIQADPGAPEILHLTDDLSESQMPGLFRACDCLAHPYRGEGFGLPVLEAMACGTAVSVTSGGATDDFCTPETALLIPARHKGFVSRDIQFAGGRGWVLEPDLEALKGLLRYAYEHQDEIQKRARLGMDHVRGKFTWDRVAELVMARIHAMMQRPVRRFNS